MKYKHWSQLLLSLYILLLVECPAAVDGDPSSDYIDLKELQVELMLNKAIENDIQSCGMVKLSHLSRTPLGHGLEGRV